MATAQPPDRFSFPQFYSFPPFFTLQPVPATRTAQLSSWSQVVQSYSRHHRLFSLRIADVVVSDSEKQRKVQREHTRLFFNEKLGRSLAEPDVRVLIDYMTTKEAGQRVEWKDGAGADKGTEFWVYWRRPEEWASVVESWVDSTGQKGVVLTVYELLNSDATVREDFHGMDEDLMQRCLQILVKRGRAQIFGSDGQQGVKFF